MTTFYILAKDPYIHSYFNRCITATCPQRQQSLKHLPTDKITSQQWTNGAGKIMYKVMNINQHRWSLFLISISMKYLDHVTYSNAAFSTPSPQKKKKNRCNHHRLLSPVRRRSFRTGSTVFFLLTCGNSSFSSISSSSTDPAVYKEINISFK